MDFASKRCRPCDGTVPKLAPAEITTALGSLPGWTLEANGTQLRRGHVFKDFLAAMRFVNALAAVAEAEGHHPDFTVRGWNKVDVTLWTHDVGGLSENDFIVAAKLDLLPESHPHPRT